MVLHTVIASGTAMSAAGTEDTLAASAFSPSGENEVQERTQSGGLPSLIGVHGVTNDVDFASSAVGGGYYRVGCNTWPTARYIIRPWDAGCTVETAIPISGGGGGVNWLIPGIGLDRDADFEVRTMVPKTANSAFAVALYESYGTPIPQTGPSDTWRRSSATSDGTVNVWTAANVTISDLDPRYKYRVNEIYAVNENNSVLAVRLTSPSNSTYVGALSNQLADAASSGPPMRIQFPYDSIIIDGVETVTWEMLVDSAGESTIYVGMTSLPKGGGSGVATTGAVGRTGGAGSFVSRALSGIMR